MCMSDDFEIRAQCVLNNRCEWTVEAHFGDGRGIAPSGASTGQFEAKTIPATEAVKQIQSMEPELVDRSWQQEQLDRWLEKKGGDQFAHIGSNAAIALSFALYNQRFSLQSQIFPFPLGNVFGGKQHGGYTDIQEFLVLPWRSHSIQEAIEVNIEAYVRLKEELGGNSVGMNDEGALIANVSDMKALDMIAQIAEDLDAGVGLDVAASEIWNGERYQYTNDAGQLDSGEHIAFIQELIETYNLMYVEDPVHDTDLQGAAVLRKQCPNTYICGDDLTVTQRTHMEKAQTADSVNAVIIKPNQTGTVTLAHDAVEYARNQQWLPVLSHRSGEAADPTISRLAVNWQLPVIKCGVAGMRTVKLNELLRLWEQASSPRMSDAI